VVRTQILLDRDTYERLRRVAAERGLAVSAFVRETLQLALGGTAGGRGRRYGFTFVGTLDDADRRGAEGHDRNLSRGSRW
jgi:hypothetical protein